jgi:hypothetical protein
MLASACDEHKAEVAQRDRQAEPKLTPFEEGDPRSRRPVPMATN